MILTYLCTNQYQSNLSKRMIAKYLFHTLGNISTVMNEIQNAFLK